MSKMKEYAQELLDQSNILGMYFNEDDIRIKIILEKLCKLKIIEIMQAQNHQENREFTDQEYFNPFHDD